MAKKSAKNVTKMEDIIKQKSTPEKEDKGPQVLQRKPVKTAPVILRGKPKSGRIWKSEKKKFSSIIKTKGIRNSLAKKQILRQKLKHVKEMSNAIKASKVEEKEKKKERRRQNLKKQEENRQKSEVVQVITNTKKLKTIRKKHLRNIEKRDTTVISKK